jgi:hypothetical protein
MKMLLKVIFPVFLMVSMAGTMFAQTAETVSDAELQQFANAYVQIFYADQEAQREMMAVLKKEGISVERYNEVSVALQDADNTLQITAEELESIKEAAVELKSIQYEAQQLMEAGIEEQGLTVERYIELSDLLQENPDMQQRLLEFFPAQ